MMPRSGKLMPTETEEQTLARTGGSCGAKAVGGRHAHPFRFPNRPQGNRSTPGELTGKCGVVQFRSVVERGPMKRHDEPQVKSEDISDGVMNDVVKSLRKRVRKVDHSYDI